MKVNTSRRRIAPAIAFTVGLLAAGIASSGNLDFVEQAYAEELNRCIDMIRPVMPASGAGKIIYDVQQIDLRGPWYQFEISVSIEEENGATKIDGYKIGCKSNRWGNSATLQARRNRQQLPTMSELLASQ